MCLGCGLCVEKVVSEWDARFISVDHASLFDLLTAADYLNIPSLLLLTSAKLASLLKGKTPEEIRRTFNIVNDFTPEEEAQASRAGEEIVAENLTDARAC